MGFGSVTQFKFVNKKSAGFGTARSFKLISQKSSGFGSVTAWNIDFTERHSILETLALTELVQSHGSTLTKDISESITFAEVLTRAAGVVTSSLSDVITFTEHLVRPKDVGETFPLSENLVFNGLTPGLQPPILTLSASGTVGETFGAHYIPEKSIGLSDAVTVSNFGRSNRVIRFGDATRGGRTQYFWMAGTIFRFDGISAIAPVYTPGIARYNSTSGNWNSGFHLVRIAGVPTIIGLYCGVDQNVYGVKSTDGVTWTRTAPLFTYKVTDQLEDRWNGTTWSQVVVPGTINSTAYCDFDGNEFVFHDKLFVVVNGDIWRWNPADDSIWNTTYGWSVPKDSLGNGSPYWFNLVYGGGYLADRSIDTYYLFTRDQPITGSGLGPFNRVRNLGSTWPVYVAISADFCVHKDMLFLAANVYTPNLGYHVIQMFVWEPVGEDSILTDSPGHNTSKWRCMTNNLLGQDQVFVTVGDSSSSLPCLWDGADGYLYLMYCATLPPIPDPTIVVSNRLSWGGLRCFQFSFNQSPTDHTEAGGTITEITSVVLASPSLGMHYAQDPILNDWPFRPYTSELNSYDFLNKYRGAKIRSVIDHTTPGSPVTHLLISPLLTLMEDWVWNGPTSLITLRDSYTTVAGESRYYPNSKLGSGDRTGSDIDIRVVSIAKDTGVKGGIRYGFKLFSKTGATQLASVDLWFSATNGLPHQQGTLIHPSAGSMFGVKRMTGLPCDGSTTYSITWTAEWDGVKKWVDYLSVTHLSDVSIFLRAI